ncbi:MAG: DUF2103 domain-containing protein [Aquificaceae bacterium]
MAKFRKSGVKLEHSILEGLDKHLKALSQLSSVSAIIPGRIFRAQKGRGSHGIFLKYQTKSGYKLLYKAGTSVQEVFIVCKDKDEFLKAFKDLYP